MATKAPAKAGGTSETLNIRPLIRGTATVRIIGETPMFQNRMANKAKMSLLVGSRKKTKAEREDIKHDPFDEYRDSAELLKEGPTALGLKVTAIKGAMATAALETPGLTKTAVNRLIFMPGELVPLYGTPYLRMDVVRSADINRTPDIRSRLFLPRWAAEVEINYITPQLSTSSVINLLCNAGVLVGVGDFRQEKGKGNFGSFRVLGEGDEDAEWDDLVANHARGVQEAALAEPDFANPETAELMEYYFGEVRRRSDVVPIGRKAKVA